MIGIDDMSATKRKSRQNGYQRAKYQTFVFLINQIYYNDSLSYRNPSHFYHYYTKKSLTPECTGRDGASKR